MDRPAPDPSRLLEAWMEWERGENPPGRVMSNLKTAGMRELLEVLVAGGNVADLAAGTPRDPEVPPGPGVAEGSVSDADLPPASSWTPVV